MIKLTSRAKKLFCETCNRFVDYDTIEKEEIYNVKGTDKIKVNAKVAICKNCGTELFDNFLENENLKKAFRIYAEKHGLVLPENIRQIREKYGISQATFAAILGIGKATIERYENGSLPSESLSNLIRSANDPERFLEMLENNKNKLSPQKYQKIYDKVKDIINDNQKTLENTYIEVSNSKNVNFQKLYATVSVIFETLKKMKIHYVYKTKFFKLLWFVESKYYDKFKQRLTGVEFAHLPMGPAPDKYHILLEALQLAKVITLIDEEPKFEDADSDSWTCIVPNNLSFKNILNDKEIEFIEKIIKSYGKKSKKELIELSHKDPRWENTNNGEIIPLE
ncbi:type II TA system antitoxin MqsA family protein [Thermosipho globiformans]|uniref:type II TA system antitoxin MqsA family protein n=1 Tax=Thermosipho globiformans TaxID=380685 RepID=UPI0013DFE451|nr:type II TA system antitoxin MqsA family protein [Thermosipho globiformans]